MENKKYLDKVLDHLVRGTKIDYNNTPDRMIDFQWIPSSLSFSSFSFYCKNTFGLTDDEIEYVWNEYRSIILDKIKNNGQ